MAEDIVGRDSELAALERFLSRVGDGPAAALIEGEAGIGKTSLWENCVGRAESRSWRVLRCRPAEAETKLSYAGLADLLAPVTDDELVELIDVQRHALEAALLRAGTPRAADPRAIATGLAALISRLADDGPVVVAVDDVQWLDSDSARALEFAVRRLPSSLALIVARRTNGQGAAPLGLERSLPAGRLERSYWDRSRLPRCVRS